VIKQSKEFTSHCSTHSLTQLTEHFIKSSVSFFFEQSSPINPGRQKQVPLLQNPFPEQLFKQFFKAQSFPLYPSLQMHSPSLQNPLPEQFLGQRFVPHVSPSNPAKHLQIPTFDWHTPFPLQLKGHCFNAQSSPN